MPADCTSKSNPKRILESLLVLRVWLPRPSRYQMLAALLLATMLPVPLFAQAGAVLLYQQAGGKLVGTGAAGAAIQGLSVAISADGTTAIVGGPGDNGGTGAAWVYTWNGSAWTQQGSKLVGSGTVGGPNEGTSVALSGDGNTALLGGENDDGSLGAAWVFTRSSGGVWTQAGSKLVGTGAVGAAGEGGCVALSADGHTAAIGALDDNSNAGAVWIFTQNGGVWTQQGSKLVGTGGNAAQQCRVALSADGSTLLVGGPSDSDDTGAVWVFTRSGSTWTQQGSKLVGTGSAGAAGQGQSVALSGDGNSAAWGGPNDSDGTGAAWVFTRSGSTWTQQGSKLVATVSDEVSQGSVSLSTDGNTLVDGAPFVNGAAGGAWIFTRSSGTWSQQGAVLTGSGFSGPSLQSSVAMSGDASTFVIGGQNDNSGVGAAWVFNRNINFGAVDVTGNGTLTINVLFLSNFTLGNIDVVTGDAPTPNFALAAIQPGGACTAGTAYTAGESCSLAVQFAPNQPGLLLGSVLLYNNSNGLEGALPMNGIGLGALAGFVSGEIVTVLPPNVELNFPVGVAFDSLGNIFVADTVDNLVREYNASTRQFVIVAGNGTAGYSGDGGLATGAELNTPENLVFDGAGNLYFADQQNNVIRAVNSVTGIIETVAGNGTGGFGGDGGPATSAELQVPAAPAIDVYGNLYIADAGNEVIRKVEASTGIITSIVGTAGVSGYSGDGGPAASAELSSPLAVALDSAGNLYIADDGNAAVRRVDAVTGIITTVAGTGTAGFLGDGGPATSAELWLPDGLALDSAGNIYITDTGNNAIRKVSADTGLISTVVGTPTVSGYSGDGGPATQAQLNTPIGLALDPLGDILFTDSGNNVVRIVSAFASPINFGSIAVGSTTDQDVTLTNNGNVPLVLTSLTATANFSVGGFDTTCTSSTTLNPGDSCVLDIVFAPVTGGDLTGVVNLLDNAAPQEVNLSGTGIPLSTTTAVISSLNPSGVGQSVTFTATVTPVQQNVLPRTARPHSRSTRNTQNGGGGAPAVTVNFYDGSTLLGAETANADVATFTTSALFVGSHNITAVFVGNAAYLASTSPVLVQVVVANSTATALIAAPNPATVGQSVVLTATVTPVPVAPGLAQPRVPEGEPSLGTVSFYFGETLLGSGNLNSVGVATLSTTSLPAGADGLTAVYSGDTGFAASTSDLFTETILVPATASTTTALTASPNPATSGATVTFTATISPAPTGTPAGTVSFYSGTTLLGTGTVNSSGVATFTSSSLPTGALSITAVYSGNTGFTGSTSTSLTETVSTTYTVTAPPVPVTVAEGGSVEINVTVPPVGGAFNNVVTLSASGLPPGATATFNPPTVTPGSAGAPTVMTIQLAAPTASAVHPYRNLTSLIFALGLCGMGFGGKRFRRKSKRGLALLVLAFAASSSLACGGGFLGPPTTQAGSYVVTITGTSGAAHVSTTVTVVVQ
jgi:hypothetical protein